jgi:hypothetical protein
VINPKTYSSAVLTIAGIAWWYGLDHYARNRHDPGSTSPRILILGHSFALEAFRSESRNNRRRMLDSSSSPSLAAQNPFLAGNSGPKADYAGKPSIVRGCSSPCQPHDRREDRRKNEEPDRDLDHGALLQSRAGRKTEIVSPFVGRLRKAENSQTSAAVRLRLPLSTLPVGI